MIKKISKLILAIIIFIMMISTANSSEIGACHKINEKLIHGDLFFNGDRYESMFRFSPDSFPGSHGTVIWKYTRYFFESGMPKTERSSHSFEYLADCVYPVIWIFNDYDKKRYCIQVFDDIAYIVDDSAQKVGIADFDIDAWDGVTEISSIPDAR